MIIRTSNQDRLPQAPREPLPELAEFLAPLRVHFTQGPSADTLRQYVTGLLSEHPNKNCDTLSEVIPETNQQQFNHLLTEMAWDENLLNRQRIRRMSGLSTEGDGALIFDDTGFEKKGTHSVGVQRQYTGTAGKLTNCQVTVNCHYAERTLAWPISTRLYLPREWAADPARRKKARVPDGVSFQTKAEIALGLLDEANQCEVAHGCVVADADYGDNPHFLNGLEARREKYVVAVRSDFRVTLGGRTSCPVARIDDLLATQPRSAWRTLTWSAGSRGRLRAKLLALRGSRVDGDGRRHRGWLIGQRPGRGQCGEGRYFWSNFPPAASLKAMAEYTHRRHWIEQYHEEAKTELGWDQYQGRRWDGFHRHAVAVMLSFSFLVWLEWHQRQGRKGRGRPRAAFSPAARSPENAAAGSASPRQRVAAL